MRTRQEYVLWALRYVVIGVVLGLAVGSALKAGFRGASECAPEKTVVLWRDDELTLTKNEVCDD